MRRAALALSAATPAFAAWGADQTGASSSIPAGTGGGADQMARLIQGIVAKHNLMKRAADRRQQGRRRRRRRLPRRSRRPRGDPHKIIITLSNLFTTPLATGVPFNWKDMTAGRDAGARPVRALGQRRRRLTRRAKDYIDAVKAAGPTQVQDGRHRLQAGRPDHHGGAREG